MSLVREVDPLVDPRWDGYVRGHDAATVYHLGAWAAILRGAYGFRPRYLASEEDGRLTGVLPLMRKKGIVSDARLRSIPVFSTAARSATRRRTSPRCWTRREAWRTGKESRD